MVSTTTVKSNSVAHAKMLRFTERKDRSLCVQMKKRIKLDGALDKSRMEELIKAIHSDGIEHVYFPRQRVPRFFFVLCKDEKVKKDVATAIRASKNTELGTLFARNVIDKEFIVEEPEVKKKKTVDPLTIVLEAIPKSLETETIKNEFPKCKDTLRFNNSRCYVYFNTIPDAYEALKRVKSGPFCGFKITARFNKVVKEKKQRTATIQKDDERTEKTKKTSPKNINNDSKAKGSRKKTK